MVTTRRSLKSVNPNFETPKPDWSSDPAAQMPPSPQFSAATAKITTASVFLHDWWLLKTSGKGLAVGGFAARERLGVRVFTSALIAKRHCATTLETTDGITITICGLINRSHAHENGFPSEVCNHFLLGFPYNWEEYASYSLGEESTDRGASKWISSKSENNKQFSLNDLPVTRTSDLLLSTIWNPEYNLLAEDICSEILRTLENSATSNAGPSINSDMECNHPIGNEKSRLNATPPKRKKPKAEHIMGGGVSTRSMTKIKNLERPCSEA
ncbi:hypothetical protein FNV43_RR02074 [Rhamnella rubrinervis]|uniref:SANTA domain-containing protein n=1 Tax=Rhamnella rubrinervis TaxID=2594499 RepID=A0A8K0MSM5_9ROSA|nr:hypothetical protein FNV43_RR02074 [Rhamnella rubrinervis]